MSSAKKFPDLFALYGPKILTNLDEKFPDWPWVCIPLPLNPITYKKSKKDPNKQMAFLSTAIWPLSENYKNAIRRSALERGDSNLPIPTHEECLNFPIEQIKQIIKAFPRLVEQVKGQTRSVTLILSIKTPPTRTRICSRLFVIV